MTNKSFLGGQFNKETSVLIFAIVDILEKKIEFNKIPLQVRVRGFYLELVKTFIEIKFVSICKNK